MTIRAALTPEKLCASLGLLEHAKRQSTGFLVRCPAHAERTPSCSVTVGPDGTARVRCFGCDYRGDALTLVATVHGLSLATSFAEVLTLGAELAGDLSLAAELREGRVPSAPRVAIAAPQPLPERDYPPQAEVLEFWGSALPVEANADSWEYLRGRGIDPAGVDREGVARVIPHDATAPGWARYQRRSWAELGHRLLVPMFDARGELRSLRGCKIELASEPTPKRLPPSGHRATGLTMANRLAVLMLRRRATPLRLVIVEGEPDFFTRCTLTADAVLGIVAGSWSKEFAAAVPSRTKVYVRTHLDAAGERYAAAITETLAHRCPTWITAA